MRTYPWGTCEALSSDHSDFALLKRLLLETGFEELKEETEKRYYKFREEQLLNLADESSGCVARLCASASCRFPAWPPYHQLPPFPPYTYIFHLAECQDM